jgi:hypothetical protein
MQKSSTLYNETQESYKIEAKVVDRENGMQEYDNIRMVRVVSKDYNLLIMEDYMPLIGEIAGSVEVVTDSDVVRFDPIHGFFMHKKNCFYLLIEDHLAEGEEIEEVDDINDFDDSYIMEEFKNAGIFKASSSSSKADSSKATKTSDESDDLEDLDL